MARGVSSPGSLGSSVVKLVVDDWGPVAHAEVEFRPLTVFIGQNNTGKSYTAMLYYALARGVRQALRLLSWRLGVRRRLLRGGVLAEALAGLRSIVDELLERYAGAGEPSSELLDSYAPRVAPLLRDMVRALRGDIEAVLHGSVVHEIERVYSTGISELVRTGANRARIFLDYGSDAARLSLELRVSGHVESRVEVAVLDEVEMAKRYLLLLTRRLLLRVRRGMEGVDEASLVYALVEAIAESVLQDGYRGDVYYLPASRAGLLQGYRSIASAIVSLAPLAAIRGVELPGFTGPSADFLATLVSIEPEAVYTEPSVAKLLEAAILEGRVELVRESPEKPPAIIYRSGSISIPLARASSMIGELAPLDIYLRYGVVGEGDTLVIEEPEAHLHPERQAKLAELLAVLVNRMRLKLILTTHSEVLLAKLSNLVSLGSLPPVEARKLGYEEWSVLRPEQVAVYHFERRGEGVTVERLPVSEEGIPDDAFLRVVEDLYRETLDIYYRLQRAG